ncbi:MAG: thioredoxin domain-containing protein [Chlorobi bacterium]|nr:thioredoxin domain-containing protein [Chlorobiota bacterium]
MRKTLLTTFFSCILIALASCISGQKNDSDNNQLINTKMKQYKFTNKLINETSPYLLQHAHNPVNWYPWGEEALNIAKEENKLLLISIGYAACHWCHVMEHESFEDEEVANIMNENFICIKVDREERPDIDQVYMNAVQLITNGGGWPLNCFALPDGRPFFGGTYFKKEQWKNLLVQIHQTYLNEPQRVIEYAEKLKNGIVTSDIISVKMEVKEVDMNIIESGFHNWEQYFDKINGGNARAPKFPLPNSYQFLLQYFYYTHDSLALEQLNLTLSKMLKGGIYDQIGGGFARYSVDKYWMVPHFEKMLYDNGQLISLYSEAFQLTKNSEYKKVVNETINFIESELTSPDYGFYSSLDADSDGEEGKYYVWKKKEIEKILSKKESDIFLEYYNVTENGNWENTNILFRSQSENKLLEKYELTKVNLDKIIKSARNKLIIERNKRVRPRLDDKILTSWNALLLKGLTDAYKVFNNKKYLELALKNANFIENNLIKNDFRIDRNYKNGKSNINGFLDDYANIAEAFISLYQVTFNEKWLNMAKSISDYAILHFYDHNSGMFFYTSDIDKALVARKMELSDNVIPASNSVFGQVLLRLGIYYYNEKYTKIAHQMLANIFSNIEQNLPYYSNWAMMALQIIYEPYEIAIVGSSALTFKSEMDNVFIPNALYAGSKVESSMELLENRYRKGETLIYVCKNRVCKKPVTNAIDALKQINDL